MKAKINLQLLNTTTFDSGALGLMAMVLHQFKDTGYYLASIRVNRREVTEVKFKVDDDSNNMQLDVDLAKAVNTEEKGHKYECKKKKFVINKDLSPDGYVLFYASSGSGYSVTVYKLEGRGKGKEVFDSTKLNEGDLFAVTLLEPAKYSMENKLGKASGNIDVSLKSKNTDQINKKNSLEVKVTEKKFEPNKIKLISSQGLVFQIKEKSRILIKKKSTRRKKSKEKPTLGWKKHDISGKK